jgi:hypothetical protein
MSNVQQELILDHDATFKAILPNVYDSYFHQQQLRLSLILSYLPSRPIRLCRVEDETLDWKIIQKS